MKAKLFISLLSLFAVASTLTSCLEGDDENTPPKNAAPILQMTNNPTGGPTVNSGLNYFSAQALSYPASHTVDTATFAVSIQGIASLGDDLPVTLSTPAEALDDYFETDGIVYEMMPSTYYELMSTSGVIKAGEGFAEFSVKFFPNKFDPTKNYMLPITASNDAGLPMSGNYGYVYYHIIGNPIAGAYKWDFIRYSNPEGTGSPDGQTKYGRDAVISPSNPTTATVKMGYFDTPNYIITFDNNGGVLS